MPLRSSAVARLALVFAVALLAAVPASGKDRRVEWVEAAAQEGALDRELFLARGKEIVEAVNAAREAYCDLPPIEWDVEASEPHWRHARWLLHHMREPWNAGGVKDFHDEVPGSEHYDTDAVVAARASVIAFKYIRADGRFDPAERWVPTIGHRLPWLLRTAKRVRVGYAEGVVPDGAPSAGFRWGVVVMEAERRPWDLRGGADPLDAAPVVCPRDGSTDVPPLLGREVPDHVPAVLDRDENGEQRVLGFPLTFSFFGGETIGSEIDVVLERLGPAAPPAVEDEAEQRGKKRKRPRKPKSGKREPQPAEQDPVRLEVYVSSPGLRPLMGDHRYNANSVVVIPTAPLEHATRYRATLRTTLAVDSTTSKPVELVTTFETAAAKPKK